MGIAGSRVAIVGGSIAGCAAAIALRRAGCAVTVFERSRGVLRDRGAGLAIPANVRDELVAAGYVSPTMRARPCTAIDWFVGDGRDEDGRFMLRQRFDAVYLNWAVLWRALRENVSDQSYRESTVIQALEFEANGANLVTDHGSEWFDVVVGADGYRSVVRPFVDPSAGPCYAGYALWRGRIRRAGCRHPCPSATTSACSSGFRTGTAAST